MVINKCMKTLETLIKPIKKAKGIAKIILLSGTTLLSSFSINNCGYTSSSVPYYSSYSAQKESKVLIKKYNQGEREFRGENLRYAYLNYELLSGANFYNANFYQANLEGSNFYYSHFNSARFFQANLREVKALYSTFLSANLYKATLSHGHFDYADFSYADMREVDLGYTRLNNATLTKTDIRGAKNLDKAIGLADVKYNHTIVTEMEYRIITKKLSEKGIEINRQTQNLFDIHN